MKNKRYRFGVEVAHTIWNDEWEAKYGHLGDKAPLSSGMLRICNDALRSRRDELNLKLEIFNKPKLTEEGIRNDIYKKLSITSWRDLKLRELYKALHCISTYNVKPYITKDNAELYISQYYPSTNNKEDE